MRDVIIAGKKLGQYVIMFYCAMGCNQFDNDKDGLR